VCKGHGNREKFHRVIVDVGAELQVRHVRHVGALFLVKVCSDKTKHNERVNQVETPGITGIGTEQFDPRGEFIVEDTHELFNAAAAECGCQQSVKRCAVVFREIVF
jgi:hypothetical protein